MTHVRPRGLAEHTMIADAIRSPISCFNPQYFASSTLYYWFSFFGEKCEIQNNNNSIFRVQN